MQIIAWLKNNLSGQNVPSQADIFGIASFGESKYIGQNIKLFSQHVDARPHGLSMALKRI